MFVFKIVVFIGIVFLLYRISKWSPKLSECYFHWPKWQWIMGAVIPSCSHPTLLQALDHHKSNLVLILGCLVYEYSVVIFHYCFCFMKSLTRLLRWMLKKKFTIAMASEFPWPSEDLSHISWVLIWRLSQYWSSDCCIYITLIPLFPTRRDSAGQVLNHCINMYINLIGSIWDSQLHLNFWLQINSKAGRPHAWKN